MQPIENESKGCFNCSDSNQIQKAYDVGAITYCYDVGASTYCAVCKRLLWTVYHD